MLGSISGNGAKIRGHEYEPLWCWTEKMDFVIDEWVFRSYGISEEEKEEFCKRSR